MDSDNVPATPNQIDHMLPTPSPHVQKKKTLMEAFGNEHGRKRLRYQQQEASPATTISVSDAMVPPSPFESLLQTHDDIPAVPETEETFIQNLDSVIAYLERHHLTSFHRALLTAQQVKDQNKTVHCQYCITIAIDPILLISHNGTLLLHKN